MKRLIGPAALLAGAGLLLTGGVARAGTAPVGSLQSGYWWQAQPQGGALPGPPQVPSGGLYVAADTSGATAVSAIRFRLQGGAVDPRLVLRVASVQETDGIAMDAFPARSSWTATSAGAWSERPAYDVTGRAAPGTLSSDRSTVSFDLAPLVSNGEVDVVIAPAPSSTSPATVYPTFDIAFSAPSEGDIQTGSSSPPAAGSAPAGTSPAATVAPQPSGSASSGRASSGSASPGSASAPAPTGPVSVTTPAADLGPTAQAFVAPAAEAGGPLKLPGYATPVRTSSEQPTGVAVAPAAAVAGRRTTRESALLGLLLAGAIASLLWRRPTSTRASQLTIYDLPVPPAPQGGGGGPEPGEPT